jgi:integrase
MPGNDTESNRKPFTKEEIQRLWDNVDKLDFLDTVLIMIYTGLRIGELLLIKNSDIHLEERYMRGGIKTAAGRNRVIPINKKILPLIKARYEQDHKYLVVNFKNEIMKYGNYYREKWPIIMEQLQLDHGIHDCRHTCATLLDNAGANKLSIKRILGHASQDITDKVYTHKDIEELLKAIDLI